MLSGKFEKSWSIKECVADILADSRNKGTFDSKSRKKETPGPRLRLHGSAISPSYGLSTSCETALCWHRQQVNTFQTSQVHRHSCFSMFWQFLQFFSFNINEAWAWASEKGSISILMWYISLWHYGLIVFLDLCQMCIADMKSKHFGTSRPTWPIIKCTRTGSRKKTSD